MKSIRLSISVAFVAALALLTPVPALAADTGGSSAPIPGSAQAFPTAQTDTYSFPLSHGGGTVGVWFGRDSVPGGAGSVTPMTTWGSSYAYSTDWSITAYKGYAKAAGNVYSGQRIVQVCFWYSMGGVTEGVVACSAATSTGTSWVSGYEVTELVEDSWDSNAPKMIFNVSRTLINPNIY